MSARGFTVLPAVDVTGGAAVRLSRGVVDSGASWGPPAQVVRAFAGAGAAWVHLVDLDRAYGRGDNDSVIRETIRGAGVDVELSGGVRDAQSLRNALEMGSARVNIATQALADMDFVCGAVRDLGPRAAVCLDVEGERLRARGGGRGGGLWEAIDALNRAGARLLVVTDVHRDGMMAGSNIELLQRVSGATDAGILASGGVDSLDDLRALAAVDGVEGVIVGKAFYEGAFTLEEALEAVWEARQ